MKNEETNLQLLQKFIPPGTFELVIPYFKIHCIHLTISRERKSILGDYRHPTGKNPAHRISVNASLNPYSFLITLLHEIAHMLVFIRFKNTVSPHGKEWKAQFQQILISNMFQLLQKQTDLTVQLVLVLWDITVSSPKTTFYMVAMKT